MALIKCNECGHMVSDKATTCPNCGYPLHPHEEIGSNNNFNEGVTKVAEQHSQPKGKKKKKQTRKRIITSLLLAAIAIEAGVLYYFWRDHYQHQMPANNVAVTDSTALNTKDNAKMQFILHNDDTGDIIDENGNRICGFELLSGRKDRITIWASTDFNFFGQTTKKVYLYKGYAYLDLADTFHDNIENGIPYEKKEQGTSIVFSFFSDKKAPAPKDQKSSTSNNNNSSGISNTENVVNTWKVSSPEELEEKINGTIWTCRPAGKMWYRLVFSNSRMKLFYANPISGKWMGGSDQDEWSYHAKYVYTSDTGEKCLTIQFTKPDRDVSFGAMFFGEDGRVNFSWLRGREGGDIENKDFNWE